MKKIITIIMLCGFFFSCTSFERVAMQTGEVIKTKLRKVRTDGTLGEFVKTMGDKYIKTELTNATGLAIYEIVITEATNKIASTNVGSK